MEKHIDEFLERQKKDGSLRELRPVSKRKGSLITVKGKEYIDFSSNNYLGLTGHPQMIQASKEAAEKYGTGSGAARLLSGDSDLFHELEDKTAKFKNKESALVFNSGYQANVGIISALFGLGDVIFADRFVHASIIDGIMLSGAQLFRFRHNDAEHLKMLLQKNRSKFKNALIVTESIFSMDGDTAPLKELAVLNKEFDCTFMVDEAHATGIYGKNGSGMVEEEDLTDQVELIMGTFSKALGSFGAYLACSKKIKQYLVNTCRSFIFSSALPPSVIACNIKALELVQKGPGRRDKVRDLSQYFRGALRDSGISTESRSQIIPVVVGENEKTVKLSEKMGDTGIWVLPIKYPTVPKGEARLRFSVTYDHERSSIDRVVGLLKKQ